MYSAHQQNKGKSLLKPLCWMLPEGKRAVYMMYYVSLGFVVQSRHELAASAKKGEGLVSSH